MDREAVTPAILAEWRKHNPALTKEDVRLAMMTEWGRSSGYTLDDGPLPEAFQRAINDAYELRERLERMMRQGGGQSDQGGRTS